MPSRRRSKSSAPSVPVTPSSPPRAAASGPTDVERFAAALKDSARADREKADLAQQARAQAALAADEAAAHEAALSAARRDLERAVLGVRAAKQAGKGRADADAAWKVAKALVIELETGAPPSWAPAPVAGPAADELEPEASVAAPDVEAEIADHTSMG
ncbi:MAG: hypothetical protein KA029_18085 [Ilumatobacteraceae bacterium]|nr:hypothetical protein [Ilumatobacteraceae bacterium]